MIMISIFGSTGFIGSRYRELYGETTIQISREDNQPKTKDVLYLISTTDNYNVFDDIHIDINTNMNVLMNTLRNCDKNTVFNFISSWFVYGAVDLPAKESSYCNPKGFYSITKRAAEQLLISYCETFDIKYRILRLCNVYGPNDNFSSKRNALQFILEKIKQSEPVDLYYGGEFVRDYMHIDDVCRSINHCINNTPLNEIYNIGSGIPTTFKHIADYAIRKFNSTSSIRTVNPPKFHKIVQVKDMYLDVSKLSATGCPKPITIEHGIDMIYG